MDEDKGHEHMADPMRVPYAPIGAHTKICNNQMRSSLAAAKAVLPAPMDFFSKLDGEHMSDAEFLRLHEFAARYTADYLGPVLVYSLDMIAETMTAFAELCALGDVEILMAAKAMVAGPVFTLAARHLSGFDVSNEVEYKKLPSELAGKTVFVTAPILARDFSVFTRKGNALVVTLDSLEHHRALSAMDLPVDYCIRLSTSNVLGQDSHFGVAPEQVDVIRRMVTCGPHRFRGFHMHSGWSTNNTPDAYVAMADTALRAAAAAGAPLGCLNLGGGICFLSVRELHSLISRLKAILPPGTVLFFEPGRPITERGGFALGRVEEVAARGSDVDLVLDLSFESHLRWTDPTLIVPSAPTGGVFARVRIVGPTCAEGDVLGVYDLPMDAMPFRRGDVLMFGDVVGYSACWNIEFNGRSAAHVAYL